ncbi:putative dsRNA-binding protein [Lacrimispora xylanisolvens]|uniref:putative dsRNA-binding protein n=1 Tax=Lacrimispora xylanisolvens TaxID=384636 RepID=UPI003D9C9E1D
MQEIVQSQTEEALTYELLKEEGPDHNKIFETQVKIGDAIIGQGTGRTKKAAEQVAAYHGILKLRGQ